jgi:hypothetical protein
MVGAQCYSTPMDNNSSGHFFRIMLSLSLFLFFLLILEVMPWHNNRILHGFTRSLMLILLWIDAILITLIIPAIIGCNTLQKICGYGKDFQQQQQPQQNHPKNSNKRNAILVLLGSTIGIHLSLTFFRSFDTMVVSNTPSSKLLQKIISRICAFGLTISSALNGFGSVSLPYSFLVGYFHEPISPRHIANAEEELQKIHSLLQYQKRCSSTTAASSSNKWFESTTSTSTLIRRSVPSSKLDNDNNNSKPCCSSDTNNHDREIATIEELYEDLTRELEEMRSIAKASSSSSSSNILCSGHLFQLLGVMFSMVLILRLCLATTTILSFSWRKYRTASISNYYSVHYGSAPERLDPITRTLTWLAGHNLVSIEKFHNFSQVVCLIVAFGLSYSQVGNFLRIVFELNRRFHKCFFCIVSRPKGEEVFQESNSTQQQRHYGRYLYFYYPNIVSIIMGSYFLSCVVVIGTNLPKEFRAPLVYALQGATFSFNPWYLDLIYTISATITLILFASITGIRRQNSMKRYLLDDFMDSTTTAEQRQLDSVC